MFIIISNLFLITASFGFTEHDSSRSDIKIERSIILLFDASESMLENNKIGEAKIAAKNYLTSGILRSRDEVALIVFYDCNDIRVEQPFTTNKVALISKIDDIQPYSLTPLKVSIKFAKDYLDNYARGKVKRIIVYTDGMETCNGEM